MTQEIKAPVPDDVWNAQIKPNLANLPTNMLVELARAKKRGDFGRETAILAQVVEMSKKKGGKDETKQTTTVE